MIHCITANREKNITGFIERWEDYDNGDFEFIRGRGLTEGFTQYVSKIRNRKYGVELNSYPILTEQTENLVELLGEEEYLDAAYKMLWHIRDCHFLIRDEFLKFQNADDGKLLDICERIEDELIQGFLAYYIEFDIIAEGLLFNHLKMVADFQNRDRRAITQLLNGIIEKVNKANSNLGILLLNNRRIKKIKESDIFI